MDLYVARLELAVARAILNPVGEWIAAVAVDVEALLTRAFVFEGRVGHLESLHCNKIQIRTMVCYHSHHEWSWLIIRILVI
jgi:hypothetical protein